MYKKTGRGGKSKGRNDGIIWIKSINTYYIIQESNRWQWHIEHFRNFQKNRCTHTHIYIIYVGFKCNTPLRWMRIIISEMVSYFVHSPPRRRHILHFGAKVIEGFRAIMFIWTVFTRNARPNRWDLLKRFWKKNTGIFVWRF